MIVKQSSSLQYRTNKRKRQQYGYTSTVYQHLAISNSRTARTEAVNATETCYMTSQTYSSSDLRKNC